MVSDRGDNPTLSIDYFAQVKTDQILSVRDALLNAGSNLWQPVSLKRGSMEKANILGGGDEEVGKALEQLLLNDDRGTMAVGFES